MSMWQSVDEWPSFCWPSAAGVFVFINQVKLLNKFSSVGATLSMRSLVKEEPDWRTGIMAGDRSGMVSGPLRLRRGSRFTWRKECQSIMERWVCLSSSFYTEVLSWRSLIMPFTLTQTVLLYGMQACHWNAGSLVLFYVDLSLLLLAPSPCLSVYAEQRNRTKAQHFTSHVPGKKMDSCCVCFTSSTLAFKTPKMPSSKAVIWSCRWTIFS